MYKLVSVYYFTLLLLHVSAPVCQPQGTRLYLLSYMPTWVWVYKILSYVIVCLLCGGLVRIDRYAPGRHITYTQSHTTQNFINLNPN
jgi:hypothetical protein